MITQNYNTQPSIAINELFRNLSSPRQASPWQWTETDDAWKGEVDLPGFTREEVTVSLDKDRLLVVEARQADLPESESRDFSRSEKTLRLRIPREVDAEKLGAKLEDGVLRVTLPKVIPDSQIARKIELN